MNLSADRSTPTSAPTVHPTLREAVRAPRRRRPTGEPPPLPYHLQTSGVGWLIAAGVLIVLSFVVFRGGLRGPAIAVTVVDDAVVGWLGGSQLPGLVGIMRGLAALSSWWMLNGLALGLLLTLLVLRRLRHLIVSFTLAYLMVTIAAFVGASIRRPRPFGVVIQAGWGGWALPSQGLSSVMVDEDGYVWLVDFDQAEAAASQTLLDHDLATLLAALDDVADAALVRATAEQTLGQDTVGRVLPPAASTPAASIQTAPES
jgi:hypothetical protein